MRALVLVTLFVLTGCEKLYGQGFEIRDPDAVLTEAYAAEIGIAADVIREQEGVLHRRWGGVVTVVAEPFSCYGGEWTCNGWADDGHNITVVYAPDLGLGPAVGATAIEWELCNAARYIDTCGSPNPLSNGPCEGSDGPATVRCVENAMPKVRQRLVEAGFGP